MFQWGHKIYSVNVSTKHYCAPLKVKGASVSRNRVTGLTSTEEIRENLTSPIKPGSITSALKFQTRVKSISRTFVVHELETSTLKARLVTRCFWFSDMFPFFPFFFFFLFQVASDSIFQRNIARTFTSPKRLRFNRNTLKDVSAVFQS